MSKCRECNGTGIFDVSNELFDITCKIDKTCMMCDGSGEVSYSCDKCADKDTCKFAYDAYNTQGDCLAEK